MMKKKNERQAKEKEERHKKETEAMALKRKAEVAKIFAKTRIPVPKHHNMPEHEVVVFMCVMIFFYSSIIFYIVFRWMVNLKTYRRQELNQLDVLNQVKN